MATSYFSTVFDQPAGEVWAIIRDFNNYGIWIDGVIQSTIEGGRSGDAIGAVRAFTVNERVVRQRLLAQSDLERYQFYGFCEPLPVHMRNYTGTLRVSPIVDTGGSFVEWSATFDCALSELDRWTQYYRESFQGWLESLRRYLVTRES